jgi:hypothetical protein
MTQPAHDNGAFGIRAGPDGRPSALTGRDLMHGYTAPDIEADRVQVALNASLYRVIGGAPVQNKLVVFGMMASNAADRRSPAASDR